MKKELFFLIAIICTYSCTNKDTSIALNECQKFQVKSEIEANMKRITECAKNREIDCFMASCDSTFILESNESQDSNRIIVRDSLKKDILQSWSIINKFITVVSWIDSIHVPSSDSTIVFTNQFFHRTFKRPNNLAGEDDVISTQRHREVWLKRNDGWKQSRIKELGGFIYVNGKPYSPK
jgi:uncharacterized protein YlzI (FlbEa/FlbD family)